jgi:hypothetical protein
LNNQDKIIRIATLSTEHESTLPLIRAEFDKENIIYQIRSHHDSAYDGIFLAQKGLADLYVFSEDKNRAEEILNNLL